MANRSLVPVGHVFDVFAAHDDHDIILGIEVKGSPFGTRNTLVVQNPKDESEQFEVRVHTLEHERQRTNVAQSGKQYGVKPFRHGSEVLLVKPKNWLVFALANESAGAAKRTPKTWPRPGRQQQRTSSFSQTRW